MKKTIRKSFSVLSMLSLVSLSAIAVADDTDIIDFEYSGGSNILFVMDMSGSMDYDIASDTIPADPLNSRKSVLHKALKDVLNNPDLTDINVGISSFAGYTAAGTTAADSWNQWGHGVTYPIASIDADADTVLNSNTSFVHKGSSYLPVATIGTPAVSISSRGYVGDSVPTTWTPFGGTPIVDALYEAALYFRGSTVDLGNHDPSDVRSAHPSSYTGTFGDAANPPTYKSPITKKCSNNAIVLLSDGRPTLNSTASKVQSLVGGSCAGSGSTWLSQLLGLTDEGRCGKELAKFLATNDNNSTLAGDQFVKTHTIGVALNDSISSARVAKRYLKDVAKNGGGEFVNANTPADLADALESTITLVSKARSFTSPTYTPDLSSLLSNSDDVYIPVFDRGTGPAWSGNLKKFKLVNGKLYDADGNYAINSDGALKDTAKDYWSTGASTHAVKSGGAANQIEGSASRKVYTDAGVTSYPALLSSKVLKESNAAITASVLGDPAMTATDRIKYIEFIRGDRPDKLPRYHMGDIIHSKPVHLAYDASNHKVIFVGTNEGFLHAIKDKDGKELFAFMPKELLKGIKTQYDNKASEKHLYGVDGPITLWHDDVNSNRIVDNGEEAIIYFGLRRGGKSYYAIDVSERKNPKLLWKIDPSTTGFSDLGYSWSQPVRAMMKFGANTVAKPVLVFGGGYIDDSATSTEADGTGRAAEVYIVDAEDGSLVWKTSDSKSTITPLASKAEAAKYTVPARIRVLDVDKNGSLDRLYYGDTGGNIWRVDFQDSYKLAADARVMHFAELGSVSSPATSRRMFFVEPDVALFKHGGKYIASVSIGSGERPKPLDFTGDDHFFAMFDKQPLKTFKSTDAEADLPLVITISNLVDATTAPVNNALTGTNKGWFTDLVKVKGEKVLARALTYKNMVMFTTLGATTVTITACGIQSDNFSRLYALNLLTGGAVLDLDDSGTTSQATMNSGTSVGTGISDASKLITSGEILETPQIIFDKLQASDDTACKKDDCVRKEKLCTNGSSECIDLPAPYKSVRKVFWIDKE